ncbi:MAG: universal stress protein [Gammaproteobacteria bacterium]|nr:universal stress protein [Gammaproteobacteria bacterium]
MTEIKNDQSQQAAVGEQPVLVATDYSDDSKEALLWACKYAVSVGSKLVLLHIVHDNASKPGFYNKASDKQLKPLQEVAEGMMAEFLAEVKAEHPDLESLDDIEQQFIRGLPSTRIVEISDLLNASLIVVGSRGITGLPHMLLGSVAERVVELAHIPVVVVKTSRPYEPGKKEVRRQRKLLKKERKWLKEILGVEKVASEEADKHG